jgi:uncharacterized Rmd1/YagE family protein
VAEHQFRAVAFPENFALKDVARAYPEARAHGTKELHWSVDGGAISFYPFGAVTFRGVSAETQTRELAALGRQFPKLSAAAVEEDFLVREAASDGPRLEAGVLTIGKLTPARAEVVSLIVAQSAAMEYYERIVDSLFANTDRLVDRLERSGTVTFRVRELHRFIGQAVGSAARRSRSCTCSTSRTLPGTTRRWTASTTSSGPSST